MQTGVPTGHNPVQSLQQSTVTPLAAPVPQAQPLPTLAPVQQDIPLQTPVSAPVNTAVQTLGTALVGQCSMNAFVKLETRAVIELPWDIFAERFDYAFIGQLGELVVAVEAPRFDKTTDAWIVEGETIVFGTVPDAEHWRDSLTIRPDEHVSEEVEEEELLAPVVVTPAEPELTTIDTSTMSRNQFKRHKSKMAAKGLKPDGTPLD